MHLQMGSASLAMRRLQSRLIPAHQSLSRVVASPRGRRSDCRARPTGPKRRVCGSLLSTLVRGQACAVLRYWPTYPSRRSERRRRIHLASVQGPLVELRTPASRRIFRQELSEPGGCLSLMRCRGRVSLSRRTALSKTGARYAPRHAKKSKRLPQFLKMDRGLRNNCWQLPRLLPLSPPSGQAKKGSQKQHRPMARRPLKTRRRAVSRLETVHSRVLASPLYKQFQRFVQLWVAAGEVILVAPRHLIVRSLTHVLH